MLVPALALGAWAVVGLQANRAARVSLAQEGTSNQVNLLYTINNLGYTSTCG